MIIGTQCAFDLELKEPTTKYHLYCFSNKVYTYIFWENSTFWMIMNTWQTNGQEVSNGKTDKEGGKLPGGKKF